MRKLTAGNKRSFVTFTIIVIGIIAILIWCLMTALKIEKEEYQMESNNFLYDEEFNPLLSETTGVIKKKWNGSYYFKEDGKKEEYKLGEQTVTYQKTTRTINLFGDMYRVFMDGTVSKLTKNNVINKISEDQLYKLADRKYLLVSNTITNETGTLNTSGYLLILIDKAGNTYLLNYELNSKTLKPMTIYTQTFSIDIANERLIYNDKEIDLKKIIGSTNQYVEPEISTGEEGDGTGDGTTIIQNGGSQTTTINNNQETINNNSSTTTVNNNQGNSGIADSNNNGNESRSLTKSVSLRSTTPGPTYIDVGYNVVDPEDGYQIVYLLVDNSVGTSKTIALDKDANTYRITGLEPNQEYKISLVTKALNDSGEVEETMEDVTTVKTISISSKLEITKITLSQIHFNLNLDTNQTLDEAEVVIYVDAEAKERKAIDITAAMSSSGWDSYFDNITYAAGSSILVKVENAKFNDEVVQLNLEAKASIY